MAKTVTTEVKETKEIKPIILKDESNGEVYVLEFDRASVKFAELKGFKINTLDDGLSLSAIEDLFFYAFRKHQLRMTKADTDKILYEKLGGMPDGMLERLVNLYLF